MSSKPMRPSNTAHQYGAVDSGLLCCKVIVMGEEVVTLVDTSSDYKPTSTSNTHYIDKSNY